MKTRIRVLSTIVLLLSFFFLPAQEKTELNSQDGIFVSYTLTRIETGAKKDTYLAMVKAENRNSTDLYYSIPLTRLPNGKMGIAPLQSLSFSNVVVRNSTGLFGDHADLKGTETNLLTEDGSVLFLIARNSTVTSEKEFKVKTGTTPILTNSFLFSTKPLNYFNIAMNEDMITGDWISSCGSSQMALTMTQNELGETFVQQSVNGKKFLWKKRSANTFERLGNPAITLSFSKVHGTFNYSTDDGVSCEWTRK